MPFGITNGCLFHDPGHNAGKLRILSNKLSENLQGREKDMAFPDAWLDELLAKNDIVSVISSYMELKPKGRRLWGLCPLHG